MKILRNKTYQELLDYKSKYLDLLWKPFQGVFEKVTDDDLLRENGLLNAENERLNNIINKVIEYIEENKTSFEDNLYCFDNMLEDVTPLLNILKEVDKSE